MPGLGLDGRVVVIAGAGPALGAVLARRFADEAAQVVLVGDPGQIAPVVRADTTRWNHHATGPHLSAPVCVVASIVRA